jgi:hypothetical protein
VMSRPNMMMMMRQFFHTSLYRLPAAANITTFSDPSPLFHGSIE